MKYYELWIILWQWKKEFTVKEFISTFRSPISNKVLFDMTKKGFLEKKERGTYKVNTPEDVFKKRADVSQAYDLLKETKLKYALTGVDSVFIWTKGGYQVGRFFGFYPIYLKILKSDLARWKKYLKSKNMQFYIDGEQVKETFFGIFYVLEPETIINTKKISELYVDTLKETINFCKNNIYQYEPALEMLNEMYNLKLKVRYREI